MLPAQDERGVQVLHLLGKTGRGGLCSAPGLWLQQQRVYGSNPVSLATRSVGRVQVRVQSLHLTRFRHKLKRIKHLSVTFDVSEKNNPMKQSVHLKSVPGAGPGRSADWPGSSSVLLPPERQHQVGCVWLPRPL